MHLARHMPPICPMGLTFGDPPSPPPMYVCNITEFFCQALSALYDTAKLL